MLERNDGPATDRGLLARLPAVAEILQHPVLVEGCRSDPASYVTTCVRRAVGEVRERVLAGEIVRESELPDPGRVARRAVELVRRGLGNRLVRAVNGTGVILHTGLGRAPLAPSAREALMEAVERYCILATDRETGKRGDRNIHIDELLCEISGAEASLVVNNNSAAVMLALHTFGEDRESIVSRGELVEIGGSFRVPDVMRRSRTVMVEVGTTNKTHLRDYIAAITDHTAILLKVHTSNYRIEGFHAEVPVRELADLAHRRGLVVVMDLGSGALVDIRRWGLPYEPTVQEAVSDGADIVTFSGDKMLGGPQCGVIVGRRELVERMRVNPLMRAFRCDKMTLAALTGTVRLFLDPDRLPETHPVYAMLTAPVRAVNRRARRIAKRLRAVTAGRMSVQVEDGSTEMGSGSLPARGIPSRVVAVDPGRISAERLARGLRRATPPLFTRLEEGRVIIDARTVADVEVRMVEEAFRQALRECGGWVMRSGDEAGRKEASRRA